MDACFAFTVCFQWGSGSPIQGLQLELDTSPSCLYGWLIAPIFVSRNETYCVTGSVKLLVYEASSADMKKLYVTIDLVVGERLRYSCPNLDDFNKTDRLINWTKVRDRILCTDCWSARRVQWKLSCLKLMLLCALYDTWPQNLRVS